MDETLYCKQCALKKDHPGVTMDEGCVCSFCNLEFPEMIAENSAHIKDTYRKYDQDVFRKEDGYDCLLMLSGGKDSVYMLDKILTETDRKVLAYTYDILFEPKISKDNIKKTVNALNVDHIFESDDINYKRLMKTVFTDMALKVEKQFLAEKTPCVLCSHFFILSACLHAYKNNIPYVLYCANPVQMVTLESRLDKIISGFISRVGDELTRDLFSGQLQALAAKRADELPVIVYPYVSMRSTYNAEKITEAVRQKGLYDSSPMETHCRLFGLLNYYSYKNWDCMFYKLDHAAHYRSSLKPADSLVRIEALMKDIIFQTIADTPVTEKQKEMFFDYYRTAGVAEGGIRHMFEAMTSVRSVADELEIPLETPGDKTGETFLKKVLRFLKRMPSER